MPMFPPIPPPAPTPNRRGLLASATAPANAPAEWLDGIGFQPEACGSMDPIAWTPCAVPTLGTLDRAANAMWQPILLRGYDKCSTMDGEDRAGREARARANLTATASHQAELEFHDGAATAALPQPNPFLTDGSAAPATAAAEAPRVALAALERLLGTCLHGQRGMIHANPAIVALWDAEGQLHLDGARLVTANDNVVVAGTGYSGRAPDGDPADAGSLWAYGTSWVYAIQGRAELSGEGTAERIDTGANDITTRVSQPALIYRSPCCLVAAQVDITSPS